MRSLFIALAAALALPAFGEEGALFKVEFSNPGLTPSAWTLEFHPDGNGHFRSERGHALPADLKLIEAPNIDRDVQVSPKFAEHVFQVAHRHKLFNSGCESHMKVAFQGLKKLSYSGPEGQGSCEFNYSRENDIQSLGDSLVAVATTIIEGARLETLLQHDPLGLDKEIENVQEAAGDGRAQQICSIRPILERLSEDPAVMERVRKRAKALLARAE
ncbi:MAG TPA: hypothetical protein VGG85_03790 [Terracidiphilus sp.]|jgi:hypothetical protein